MDLKQFGEQLRTLRQQAGWSQEALIEALDQLARSGAASEYRVIDGTLLSRWERAHTQKGRTWKPTRTYMLHLIQLFAPHLDLPRAQVWAEWAGYTIRAAELQGWFPTAAPNGIAVNGQPTPPVQTQSASAVPHNLPTVLTSFVGRAAETARVLNYLFSSTTRLITVVGEGGAGKTRLAQEVAHAVVNQGGDRYRDGVYFVALIGVSAASFVVSALANTLGLALMGADDPQQQLLAYLQNRRLLLVLDNFEQLVAEATPLLTAILQAAPGVQLLVTSRERLNLAEEWVVLLAGLPFPSEPTIVGPTPLGALHRPALTMTEAYEAVELFVARARQADGHFDPGSDPQQTAAIARICRLLQGIPLGIEMAAAWVHMLPCAEIGDEIARNLDFLTSPHRNADLRHRSMRAVFEQSWRLLTAAEQTVLAALSVFQGGFTREAAASVAKASLMALRSLVDKSLLKVNEGRYELHELLRQFAAEKLQLDPTQAQVTQSRHAAYYGAFLKKDEELWNTEKRPELVSVVRTEIQNVRTGWQWAATHQEVAMLEQYMQSLLDFYMTVNWYQEGRDAFQLAIASLETLALTNQAAKLVLAKALSRRALFDYQLGQLEVAARLLRKSLTIWEHQPDAVEVGFASSVLGTICKTYGVYGEAQKCFQKSWETVQKSTDIIAQADISYSLGEVAYALNDYTEANQWYQQSLALYRRQNAERGIGRVLSGLGTIAQALGHYAEAEHYYHQALSLFERHGDRNLIASSSLQIGLLAQASGDYDQAEQWYQRGRILGEETHIPLVVARAMCYLGTLACQQNQYWHAQKYLRSAFDIAVSHKATPLILQIIASAATLRLEEQVRPCSSQLMQNGHSSSDSTLLKVYECLRLIADHPAASAETRQQVKTQLSKLAISLPPASVARLDSQTGVLEPEQAVDVALFDPVHDANLFKEVLLISKDDEPAHIG